MTLNGKDLDPRRSMFALPLSKESWQPSSIGTPSGLSVQHNKRKKLQIQVEIS